MQLYKYYFYHFKAFIFAFFRICELWCGQSDGQISIYSLRDQVVVNQEFVNHFDPPMENLNVLNLVAYGNTVWSYISPGCIIYQWKRTTRSITNKLDCSKLVPCSESLKSIAIEEHLSPMNCQVMFVIAYGPIV